MTDDSFTSGFADPVPTTLSEADGCAGGDATLQLAIWDNPFLDEEPRIITENIADYHLDRGGQAITLALVSDDAEVPRPPLDRLNQLLDTGTGDLDNPLQFPEVPTDDAVEEEGSDDADDADGTEGDADAEGDTDAEGDADAEGAEEDAETEAEE